MKLQVLIILILIGEINVISFTEVPQEYSFADIVKENRKFDKFVDMCQARIVGGSKASISYVPYQVALKECYTWGMWWRTFCGGTLITLKHVITAAHCFMVPGRETIRNLENCRVVAGTETTNSFYTSFLYENSRKIEKLWKHKYYNPYTFNNDFALIELDFEYTTSADVMPVLMLSPGVDVNIEEYTMCIVSGYGNVENDQTSASLRMVCVPIVNNEVCRSYYGVDYISRRNICAGAKGKDSCQGDSGGPLVCGGVLVGIVSFGGQCGYGPGVQTFIARYTDNETPLVDMNGVPKAAMDYKMKIFVFIVILWYCM